MQERGIRSLGLEDALQKGMATHFSILPEEFHGQRSLRGYSPWDHKELDTAEQLTFYITSKQVCSKSRTHYGLTSPVILTSWRLLRMHSAYLAPRMGSVWLLDLLRSFSPTVYENAQSLLFTLLLLSVSCQSVDLKTWTGVWLQICSPGVRFSLASKNVNRWPMINVRWEVHLPTREGVNRRPVVNAWPGALLSLPQIHQEGTALSEPSCVSIPTILFLLINTTCFTPVSLYGESFLHSWQAKALPRAPSPGWPSG